jgi:hypothetical protein
LAFSMDRKAKALLAQCERAVDAMQPPTLEQEEWDWLSFGERVEWMDLQRKLFYGEERERTRLGSLAYDSWRLNRMRW